MMLIASMVLCQAVSGPLETKVHDDLKLHDPDRKKDLAIRVTFPTKAGKYPVIVFSHGLGGSKNSMVPLIKPWVESGYIVIQPTHEDSGVLNRPGAFQKSTTELAGNPINRPRDIKLILDSLPHIEKSIPGLNSKVDASKVAMAGHSYGAWTTMAIGGLNESRPLARQFKMSDPRPLCLLPISPQGLGPAINADSYKTITRPTLAISGTNDTSVIEDKPAEWRKSLFEYQAPGDKFFLWIDGATHNFGGITGARFPGSGQDDPKIVELVVKSSLAFFDSYLKQNSDAKKRMKDGTFPVNDGPKYEWKTK